MCFCWLPQKDGLLEALVLFQVPWFEHVSLCLGLFAAEAGCCADGCEVTVGASCFSSLHSD